MQLSSRQQQIINIMLHVDQGVTVGKIAEEIQISPRTVHRELREIEQIVKRYDLQLIKRSGIGVILEGEAADKQRLSEDLFHAISGEYTAEERKLMILCTLLSANEPIKLFVLSHNLKVAVPTITSDLDQLEEWLSLHQLQLIRRRGYGIEIKGTETAKRGAMISLIANNFDENKLIALLKENVQHKNEAKVNSASEKLLNLIQKDRLIAVENALKNVRSQLVVPLADSSYIALVVHLSLVIERLIKGEEIEMDELYLNELTKEPEYAVAQEIIRELEERFSLPFPKAEVGYITMHLQGAKLRKSQQDLLDTHHAEVTIIAQKLMDGVGKELGINFYEDRSLLPGLLTHLEPALHRLKRNMRINNPLLEKIKEDYGHVFRPVAAIAAESFSDLHVPDEEIGFLVLHLGSSLERIKRTKKNYRVLVVCSSGIGTSRMLANRIETEIPEIHVLRHVSLFDTNHIDPESYDLIISTIPLPKELEPFVIVSPFLDRNEINMIRHFLSELDITMSESEIEQEDQTVDQILSQLEKNQQYLQVTLDICRQWQHVMINNQDLNIEQILLKIAKQLKQDGILLNPKRVVTQLLAREKMGGLGIPGTTQVLYHTKSGEILKPSFSVVFLEHPITRSSMDGKEMKITKLLVLISPEPMSSEGTEILSEISALLIEEETIEVMENSKPDQIKAFFIKKLKNYCYQQLRERGDVSC
ncbi:BglG family transcription antiterminator [Brevibacillus daliensis]|uniref:BglG family transcription antiterminator n=1 Tax=Brevibacillus daliensis TaxID=2892995 RepID=UPI001E564FBE|nr:BglG family transcription antiterminator [Brevibacillus daliensis]